MPDTMITPFDRYYDDGETTSPREDDRPSVSDMLAIAALWGGDICYVTLTTCAFIASTLLMAMGFPMILMFIASGSDLSVAAANIGNLADHFQRADPASQQLFADKLKWSFLGSALLLHLLRMPSWFGRLWAGLEQGKRS